MTGRQTVLVVGTAIPARLDDSGLDVRRTSDPDADLTDVACVVCRRDAGVDTVRSVADRRGDLPLVYCTPEPDGRAASAATRAGADEYVPISEATLVDRVRGLLDEPGSPRAPTDATRDQPFLEEFLSVATDRDRSFEARLSATLDLGREHLDVPVAYLTVLTDDGLQVLTARDPVGDIVPGQVHDAAAPHYRETLATDGLVTVDEPSDADSDAGGRVPELAWYVGGRVVSDDGPNGALCFGRRDPRTRPFDDRERRFVELLVRWVSYELEREWDREALNDLLSATVELMTATSRERIAELVATAAADVLGFHLNTVRLVSPDGKRLEPVGVTSDLRELVGERPTYAIDDDVPVVRAFRSGSPLLDRDVGDERGLEALDAVLYLPLGDHGTLSIGTTSAGAFTADDRTLANILGANASAALDRTAREESLRRYRAVHETVREMVYVTDGDGRLQLVTPALAERVGRDRDDLESASTAELFGENASRVADEVATLREGAGQGSADRGESRTEPGEIPPASEESRTVEVSVPTAYGDEFPAEVELTMLPDDPGCVGVVRDLTELRRARDALESERERFVSLFEESPDPVADAVIRDGEPYLRNVNEAFEETFGYDESEIVGESIADLLVPPDAEREASRLFDRASEGKNNYHEVERLAADGRRTFLLRGIPYDETEAGVRVFGIFTDVTDQRDRERRIQVLHRVLRHNLRNDVTAILGYAGMLYETLDGEEAEWAGRIIRTAEELSTVSEDVQYIERTLQRDPTAAVTEQLSAIVDEVLETHRERFPAASFTAEVPSGLAVSGARLVRTAVDNLVENSVEHNDRDRPTVSVTAQRRDDGRHRTVLLAVSDDGPGIPEREQAVLTDESPITQLHHSRGLGLWLSRWIAESLGGDLRFEASDEGSTVVLELPIAED